MDFAVGASLQQKHGDVWKPCAYFSKKLSDPETRYPTHERELYTLILAVKEWCHYLIGPFYIEVDHEQLEKFDKQPNLSLQQVR